MYVYIYLVICILATKLSTRTLNNIESCHLKKIDSFGCGVIGKYKIRVLEGLFRHERKI